MTLTQIMEELYPMLQQKTYYKGIKKSTLHTIIYGTQTKVGFIHLIDDESRNKNGCLYDAIIEYSKSYTSSKKTIMIVFKELVTLLEQEGFELDLCFPDFDVQNPIERQLFLIKYFQIENYETLDGYRTIDDANDVLWMYKKERIEDDLKEINNGSLSFLGRKIQFDYDRTCGQIIPRSTGHPIMMVENLAQVLCQLQGLKKMSEDIMYRDYALISASTIWHQLSLYARKRILFVVEELLEEDSSFFQSLQEDTDLFHEEMMYHHSHLSVLDFLKNGKDFYLVYQDGEDIYKKHCLIERYTGIENIEIKDLDTNTYFTIQNDQVIFCCLNSTQFVDYLK